MPASARPSSMMDSRHSDVSTIIETIRVVAPATLEEGFTFDVLVEDRPFTVTVPKGGVKEGQEFDVPYEFDDDGSATPPSSPSESVPSPSAGVLKGNDELGAPYGRWRTHLLSCCDVFTQATFWMGFCCTPVLLAQLLTRLRLSWKGQAADDEEVSMSFSRIVLYLVGVLALCNIPVLGIILLVLFYLVVILNTGSNVRGHIRRKYQIPAEGICSERTSDCCCMLWCGCCATIQMARHTHDDKEYPGMCFTTTGLEFGAPEIV